MAATSSGGGGVGLRNALMKARIWTVEVSRKSGRLVKSCALGVPVVVDVW